MYIAKGFPVFTGKIRQIKHREKVINMPGKIILLYTILIPKFKHTYKKTSIFSIFHVYYL